MSVVTTQKTPPVAGKVSFRWRLPLLIVLAVAILPLMALSLFIGSKIIAPSVVVAGLTHFDPTKQ